MKLLLVQKDINNRNYRRFLDEAVDRNPDIVCFPELTTSGCLYEGGSGADFDQLLETLSDYAFSVSIGFPREHEGRLYNSYMYFKDGEHHIYDKINLFPPMSEPEVYACGTQPGVIETEFGKLGIAICYDLRFPKLFQQLAEGGAEKILVPAAFPRVRIADWKELIAQRARETNAHVIGVNAVGDDGTNEFGGSTMVADPSGKVLSQADEVTEQVVEAEL